MKQFAALFTFTTHLVLLRAPGDTKAQVYCYTICDIVLPTYQSIQIRGYLLLFITRFQLFGA